MPSPRSAQMETISPALRYYLMTGITPNCHICGAHDYQRWRCEVDRALPPCVGLRAVPGGMALLFMEDAAQREVWEAHADELTIEARRFGFEPAAAGWYAGAGGKGKPLDPAVTASWRRVFMAPYGRRAEATER